MKHSILYLLLVIFFFTNRAVSNVANDWNNVSVGSNLKINSESQNIHVNTNGTISINGKTYYLSTKKRLWWNPSQMLISISNLHYQILATLATILFWEWIFSFFSPRVVKLRNKIISFPLDVCRELIDNKKLRNELNQVRQQAQNTSMQPIILKYYDDNQEYSFAITDETLLCLLDQSGEPLEVTHTHDEKNNIIRFKINHTDQQIHHITLTDKYNLPIETSSFVYNPTTKELSITANIFLNQSDEQIYPHLRSSAPYDNNPAQNNFSDYPGYPNYSNGNY